MIPQHIAIVMDGNGRWAQNRGLLRIEGHCAGVETVKTVIRCCLDAQIPILSLFAFSRENWSRPAKEVEFLMQLFVKALGPEVRELHRHGICLRFGGERSGLSLKLQDHIRQAETLTAQNNRLILNLLVNYGGKWDIVQTTKRIAQRVQDGDLDIENIDEMLFDQTLNVTGLPDPDLLIRTSGEQRLSNFFLWQLAYTELYFTETLWPDFTAKEFEKALESYRQRERRYGKTSQQYQQGELCLNKD